MSQELAKTIEQAWENRSDVGPASSDVRGPVEEALALLDSGEARVAEPDGGMGRKFWRIWARGLSHMIGWA